MVYLLDSNITCVILPFPLPAAVALALRAFDYFQVFTYHAPN